VWRIARFSGWFLSVIGVASSVAKDITKTQRGGGKQRGKELLSQPFTNECDQGLLNWRAIVVSWIRGEYVSTDMIGEGDRKRGEKGVVESPSVFVAGTVEFSCGQ